MSGVAFEQLRRNGPNIVLGRAGLDLYAEPVGASVEEADTFRAALGGSSANIAVALVKAGRAAKLVTRVADDAIGRRCRLELERYGVDAAHVRPVEGRAARDARNSLGVITTRVEGFQSTIYRNGAADFLMDRADVDAVTLDGAAALTLTGTVMAAEPSRSAASHAIERAREAGVPVVFDVDYRPYSWASANEARTVLGAVVEASTLVVGNDEEWEWLAGAEPTYSGGASDMGAALARAREAATERVVVFKRGAAGSTTLADGAEFDVPAFRVEAIKPIGAGDAFLGTMLAAIQNGNDLEPAVRRGSAAAAITVSRFGCAPAIPLPDEIDRFLSER